MTLIPLLFLLVLMVGFVVILIKSHEAFLGLLKLEAKTPRTYQYNRKQYFMTRAESDCYKALVQAVEAEFFIFAQVYLSSIIDEKIKGQDWRASRAHVNRKSIDFLLCDKEYISPKLAIELDDWSHSRQDRKDRDAVVEGILKDVGLPLLRITNTDNLLSKINETLGTVST